MDSNLSARFSDNRIPKLPVSQERLTDSDMDLWEPPFERWLRLADSLLGNLPPARPCAPHKN
jgi:hypothetical protein